MQIYLHSSPEDLASSIVQLNEDIRKVNAWSQNHYLMVNEKKTQAMILGPNNNISLAELNLVPPIVVNGVQIKISPSVSNLGVPVD